MAAEVEERIAFLNSGPWIEKGKLAWQVIGERAPQSVKKKELLRLLRPHWEKAVGRKDGLVRDSFDEALTVYQLYELAIETNYIQLEDIRERVKSELEKLLWSEGARRYLRDYCYVGVAYLAQRVDVDLGYKTIVLPPIRNGVEGHFASFLSQHVLWYDDDLLDGWLAFLDDYQALEDPRVDKDVLWSFLTTAQRSFREDAALWAFVAGADGLLMRLASLADTLSTEEKFSYGTFYGYWMAKMYGYDLGETGFFRDEDQEDWPAAILKSKRLAAKVAEIDSLRAAMPENARPPDTLSLFEQRDRTVRKFWEITRRQFETDPIQFRTTTRKLR